MLRFCAMFALSVLIGLSMGLCLFLPLLFQKPGNFKASKSSSSLRAGAGDEAEPCGDALSLDTSGLDLLEALCFTPINILDIGANRGEWTKEQRVRFPSASFLMIDGNNYTASDGWTQIKQDGYGLVDQDSALLGKENGEVEWFTSGLGDTGASIHPEMSGRQHIESHTRHIETLDTFLRRTGRVMHFDLVKIDVQGAEVDIIQGANETLRNTDVILLEMPVAGIYNRHSPSFADYVAALEVANFTVFDMVEEHRLSEAFLWWGKAGFLIQVDYIFVRKDARFLAMAQDAISSIGTQWRKNAKRPHWYYSKIIADRWLDLFRTICGINALVIFVAVISRKRSIVHMFLAGHEE